MKNRTTIIDNDTILLHTSSDTDITASVCDIEALAPYRWRIIADRVVTTLPSDKGYETLATVEHIIYGIAREKTLPRRNKIAADITRSNVLLSASRVDNPIIEDGDTSYLILPNAMMVLVDTADVPLISQYRWYSSNTKNGPVVLSRTTGDHARTIQLNRLILGILHDTRKNCWFMSSDKLDMRRSNMVIGGVNNSLTSKRKRVNEV